MSKVRHIVSSTGEGRRTVELVVVDTGDGLVGILTGGEHRHVGGVVLASPRTSLTGSGQPSCDTYIVPVCGHLDVEVAREVAITLCANSGVAVTVTAGIHIDDATSEDLREIRESCRQLAEDCMKQLGIGLACCSLD